MCVVLLPLAAVSAIPAGRDGGQAGGLTADDPHCGRGSAGGAGGCGGPVLHGQTLRYRRMLCGECWCRSSPGRPGCGGPSVRSWGAT